MSVHSAETTVRSVWERSRYRNSSAWQS